MKKTKLFRYFLVQKKKFRDLQFELPCLEFSSLRNFFAISTLLRIYNRDMY